MHLIGAKTVLAFIYSTPDTAWSCARFSATDLFHKGQHGLFVLLPLVRQLALMRELITPEEDGQLHTVGVQVTEVVHT